MEVINLILIIIFMLQDCTTAFPDGQRDALAYSTNHVDEKIQKAPSSKRSQDDIIVFPSDSLATFGHSPVNDTLPCKDSNFCEDIPNYPEDLIRNALKSRHDLKYLAKVDPITALDIKIDSSPLNDDPLCYSREEIVFPRRAQNRFGEWVFVVNQDDFRQGIRTERCVSEYTTCNLIDGFAEGYVTKCKQKYYYRPVVGVLANLTVESVLAKFPSSCCCQVKFTGKTASRIVTDIYYDSISSKSASHSD